MSDVATRTWVEGATGSPYDVDNLPYGVFSASDEGPADARVGVRVGDFVLDLAPVGAADMLEVAHLFEQPNLDAFLAAGRPTWSAVRSWVVGLLTDAAHRDLVEPSLLPLADVTLHLPFTVADYVDFYCSLDHASNVGRIFRPDAEPLLPNWRHLP
ncbi:MAG: fumarylacetoacetase, partial [Nocardioides sp.]